MPKLPPLGLLEIVSNIITSKNQIPQGVQAASPPGNAAAATQSPGAPSSTVDTKSDTNTKSDTTHSQSESESALTETSARVLNSALARVKTAEAREILKQAAAYSEGNYNNYPGSEGNPETSGGV